MDAGKPVRLDLGCGPKALEGFVGVDRKQGGEVYPLDYPNESVDEIHASHILEHFSHTQTLTVLKDWVAKLKPGGLIRIAVPDTEKIAKGYLAKEAINIQGYLMGGHVDEDDIHLAVFDRECLSEMMVAAGLYGITKWESTDPEVCSSLPISLNLQACKPVCTEQDTSTTVALLSAPRFGPVMHARHAFRSLSRARIDYQIGQGAYWSQVLSEMIEEQIQAGFKYIITVDYDSIFRAVDVITLHGLMLAYPDADAICAVQSRRGGALPLFSIKDENGNMVEKLPRARFCQNLTQVYTGHFGLTIFRAEALNSLTRPWMQGIPNMHGRWAEDAVHPDCAFWVKWRAEGKSLYLANRVVIGHLEETIAWPGQNLEKINQSPGDYDTDGPPAGRLQL